MNHFIRMNKDCASESFATETEVETAAHGWEKAFISRDNEVEETLGYPCEVPPG